MRICYPILSLALAASAAQAEMTTKTISVDSQNRTYLVYTPASVSKTDTTPLILFMHPNGMTASQFATAFNIQSVSDMTKSIALVPEALDEQDSDIKSLYNSIQAMGISTPGLSITNVWGAGVSVSTSVITSKLGNMSSLFSMMYPNLAKSGKIQFNKSVNDVNFVNAIINETENSYKIDTSKVFMIGASMGGAMTYKYAYDSSSKIKGAAVICGFIGAEVDTTGKSLNIPICIFHSQADSIVYYKGGTFSGSIPETVASIAARNGCGNYTETDVPNIADDTLSIKRYDYACDTTRRVRFFSIDNATHQKFLVSDYKTGPNDIDYYQEVYKFLFGEQNAGSVEETMADANMIYPNPVKEILHTTRSGFYSIVNAKGQSIKSGWVDNGNIDLSTLAKGSYVFLMKNGNGYFSAKFIK